MAPSTHAGKERRTLDSCGIVASLVLSGKRPERRIIPRRKPQRARRVSEGTGGRASEKEGNLFDPRLVRFMEAYVGAGRGTVAGWRKSHTPRNARARDMDGRVDADRSFPLSWELDKWSNGRALPICTSLRACHIASNGHLTPSLRQGKPTNLCTGALHAHTVAAASFICTSQRLY
jgi:hypothetical protein